MGAAGDPARGMVMFIVPQALILLRKKMTDEVQQREESQAKQDRDDLAHRRFFEFAGDSLFYLVEIGL